MNRIKQYFQGFTKKDYLRYFYHLFLVVLGSLMLAFGTGAFLIPHNLVTGGLSGLGIVIQNLFYQGRDDVMIVDIVIAIANVVLFIIGWFFLGKKFSFQTLLSVIIYTAATSLFVRLLEPEEWLNFERILGSNATPFDPRVTLLLAGICGSSLVGLGCALTFQGGGSTGGLDVIALIMQKYAKIRCSISTFIIDATIIVAGYLVTRDIAASVIGIACAFVVALIIDKIFIGTSYSFLASVVSNKWEEINDYVTKEMERSTTVLDAIGGYTGEPRKMIQIAFDRKEYTRLLDGIARIDPKAFVSVTKAHEINGEGFVPLARKNKR